MSNNNNKIMVMICPKCKSSKVNVDYSNQVQNSLGFPTTYICNDCSYSGYNFPEIEKSKVKEIPKDEIEKDTNEIFKKISSSANNSYGNFQIKIIWLISGPLFILLGLFGLNKNSVSSLVYIAVGISILVISIMKNKKSNKKTKNK